MLAKRITSIYPGQVELVYEDYGESTLNDQFGIMGYPTVFLDGEPVGLPRDFGFGADPTGKYMPWINAESQQRFAADLEAAVGLAVKGESFAAFIREVWPFYLGLLLLTTHSLLLFAYLLFVPSRAEVQP